MAKLDKDKDYEYIGGSWFFNKKDKNFSWDGNTFFNLYREDFFILLDYLLDNKLIEVRYKIKD